MRTALYVIYEKSGKLPRDVEYMINELDKVVDYTWELLIFCGKQYEMLEV